MILQSNHKEIKQLNKLWYIITVVEPEPITKNQLHPGQCGCLVVALSGKPKGCGLNCWSGHMPRLQVQSPVEVHKRGN